jgi:hypothetical protein
MTNVISDEETDCAGLIDFEIRHEKSPPATARPADDLLGFLRPDAPARRLAWERKSKKRRFPRRCVTPSASWRVITRS